MYVRVHCVCMYLYVFVCICVYVCVCVSALYLYVFVCICVYLYVCMCVCVCWTLYVCLWIRFTGIRFAGASTAVVLAGLVHRYSFELVPGYEMEVKSVGPMQRPKNGLPLIVRRRRWNCAWQFLWYCVVCQFEYDRFCRGAWHLFWQIEVCELVVSNYIFLEFCCKWSAKHCWSCKLVIC